VWQAWHFLNTLAPLSASALARSGAIGSTDGPAAASVSPPPPPSLATIAKPASSGRFAVENSLAENADRHHHEDRAEKAPA
jgi:hypothetical protein